MPNIFPFGAPFIGAAGEALGVVVLNGTLETLELEYRGRLLIFTNNNPITLIVPNDGTVDFPDNAVVPFTQEGLGQVTVEGAAGVSVNAPFERVRTVTRFARGAVTKIDANEWLISGNMEAIPPLRSEAV